MTFAMKVPLVIGREVRGLLKRKRVYEDSFLPKKTDTHIFLPMRTQTLDFKQELDQITTDYSVEDVELRKNTRTRSFRRELEKILPKKLYAQAARAYEQVGDVGIITVFDAMKPYEDEIADALMDTNKGIRLVVKKVSKYKGKVRTQSYEKLAGEGSTKTVHVESGVRLHVDVAKAYFSARTANERQRVYSQVQRGEDVLVLFSGVGPYALLIAKNANPNSVVGVEMNPQAHDLAMESLAENSPANTKFFCADVRKWLKQHDTKFDRIIMPHPTEADFFLEQTLGALKDVGVVHMYLFSRTDKLDMVQDKIRGIATQAGFVAKRIEVIEELHVSPDVKKYCFDISLKKR